MRPQLSLNPYSLLLYVVLMTGCIKTIQPPDNSSNNSSNPPPPAITSVGSPIGNLVMKSIGPAGGSLVSDDGKVQLTIPAGALSANTDISIQAVTNQAPGGIGLSYHLMPDGTKFSQPVTLTFHYTDKDINGTMPYLLYIAYQDSINAWEADFVKRNVDTTAKTISLGISHFSIWSMGDRFVLLATPSELHEDETSDLHAVFIDVPAMPDPSGGELVSLPITSDVADNEITSWKVNGGPGNSTDGTISGTGNHAIYTAPSIIDQERTVTISVDLNHSLTFFNNGKQVASVNKLILLTDITLLPSEFDFTVNVDYKTQPVTGMNYEDKATFDLSIKLQKDNGGGSTIVVLGSNYQNYAPTCTPLTMHYSNGSSWTCVPGTVGVVNITDIELLSYSTDSVYLKVVHSGAAGWGAHAVDAMGNVGDAPGLPLGQLGYPSFITVALKDEAQTIPDPNHLVSVQLIPK